jgi:hypothetical protein
LGSHLLICHGHDMQHVCPPHARIRPIRASPSLQHQQQDMTQHQATTLLTTLTPFSALPLSLLLLLSCSSCSPPPLPNHPLTALVMHRRTRQGAKRVPVPVTSTG